LTHIELFSGCGGMSLGLEASGFELVFANEISPMAGETFAFNILKENLAEKAEKELEAENTLWVKSQFKKDNLKSRLKENPFDSKNKTFTDLDKSTDLKGKLLIGNIDDLLVFLKENKSILRQLTKSDIDLVSGGPPCQSFSLAGRREKDNAKNLLPLSFAKFAGLVKPKVVLLENVKGITSAFTENNQKYYAWLEVCKAFVLEGYVPVCMMINSKYFGVPQNRPRFILFAFREDIFKNLFKIKKSNEILKRSKDFFDKVKQNTANLDLIKIDDFCYYDVESDPALFDGELLPKITHSEKTFITASEAIGDLKRTDITYRLKGIKSKYKNWLEDMFDTRRLESDKELENHEAREHNFIIKSRFRFYQVISQFQNGLKKSAMDLFLGKNLDEELMGKVFGEFSKYNLLFKKYDREVMMKPKDIEEVEELVLSIPTKKHSQRALREDEPAPAQLTIPDDICHYALDQLRTLTVREMARFQSFPDWFVFRSKVTTGGDMRRFEVPQYTQVGNAVPPILAKALGDNIEKLLKEVSKWQSTKE